MSEQILKEELKNSKQQIIVAQQSFSGPLPPPEILVGYKQIVSDAPERILKMAEKEQENRHKKEKEELLIYNRNSMIGNLFAFVLCLVTLSLGFVMVIKGYEIPGVIFGTSGIISVAISLIKQNARK